MRSGGLEGEGEGGGGAAAAGDGEDAHRGVAPEFEGVAVVVHRLPVVGAGHRGLARGAEHRVGQFLSAAGAGRVFVAHGDQSFKRWAGA